MPQHNPPRMGRSLVKRVIGVITHIRSANVLAKNREDSPGQHTFPTGQQNWVPVHPTKSVAQASCCCRGRSPDKPRSPSIRLLASCPVRGMSSASSCTGWPSEITGSEAVWALVSIDAAASASKRRNKRDGRRRPIFVTGERVKRGQGGDGCG